MTDEEFLALKNKIKEVADSCYKINYIYNEFKNEISELDKSVSKLQYDVNKLKIDVDILEEV